MDDPSAAPNYQYWQENGAFWIEEYQRRKRTKILYDIQELMLAEYLARSAPARVLEYGCGIGRHLKYLRQIDGLDVHGYDQSPTMLEGIRNWADPEWYNSHITKGEPVARLPYPDNSFDIVYTTEVLIHIRPEDLLSILKELIRISKWQVFHIEPAPDFIISPQAHLGCWNHDLIQAYASLNLACEMLPKGYRNQVPYRTILDTERIIKPTTLIFSKLLEMENDIQPALDQISLLESTQSELHNAKINLNTTIEEFRTIKHDLENALHDLSETRRDLDASRIEEESIRNELIQERCELKAIRSSRGYKILRRVQENPFIHTLALLLRRVFP